MFVNDPKPYVYSPLDSKTKPSIFGGIFFNKADRNPYIAINSLSSTFSEISDSFIQAYESYYKIALNDKSLSISMNPIDSSLVRIEDYSANARVNDHIIRKSILSYLEEKNQAFYINNLTRNHLHYAFLLEKIFDEKNVSRFFLDLGSLAIRFSGFEAKVDFKIEKNDLELYTEINSKNFGFEFL